MGDPWGPGRRRASSPSGRWLLWLALVLGVVALVAFLAWRYPGAASSEYGWARVVYLIALLALVSSTILVGRRLRLKYAAKQAAVWVGIALLLALGYSYRFEIGAIGDRVLGELLPHRAVEVSAREVRFRAGVDGHFRVEAIVDGKLVLFLVDTGASGVVLSPADARRLGFDPEKLRFTGFAATANGMVRTAPIRLGFIAIGRFQVTGLPASVNRAAMRDSLLGMRFLERLRSYEVRDGLLIMRW